MMYRRPLTVIFLFGSLLIQDVIGRSIPGPYGGIPVMNGGFNLGFGVDPNAGINVAGLNLGGGYGFGGTDISITSAFSENLFGQLMDNNAFRSLFSNQINPDSAINIGLAIAQSLVSELGIGDSYLATNLLSSALTSILPGSGPEAYGRALVNALNQILMTNNILNSANSYSLANSISRIILNAVSGSVYGDVGLGVGGFGAGLGLGTDLGLNVNTVIASGVNPSIGASIDGVISGIDDLGFNLNPLIDVGANIGAGLDIGSDIDAGIGLNAGAGLGAGVDAGLGLGAGLNAGVGAGLGLGANAGLGLGANAGLGLGANAGLGLGANAGLGLGANAGLGLGANAGLGLGANAGLGLGTNAGLGLGLGLGTNAGLGLGLGLGNNSSLGLGTDVGLGANVGLGLGANAGVGLGVGANLGVGADVGLGLGTDVGLNVGVGAGLDINFSVSAEANAFFQAELIRELLKDKYFRYVFSDYVPSSALKQIGAAISQYLSKAFAVPRSFLLPLENNVGNISSDITPSPELYAQLIAGSLTNLFGAVNFITAGTARLQVTIAAKAITSGIANFIGISTIPGVGLGINGNSYNSYFSILNGLERLPYVGSDAASRKLPPIVKTAQATTFALRFTKTLFYNLISSNRFSEVFSLGVPMYTYKMIANSLGNFMAEAFGNPNPAFFSDIYTKALLVTNDKLNYKTYARSISLATTKALYLLGYFTSGNVNIQAAIATNAIIRALVTRLRPASTQVALFPRVMSIPWITQLVGVDPSQSLLKFGIDAGAGVGVGVGVDADIGLGANVGLGIGAGADVGVGVSANVGIGAKADVGLGVGVGVDAGVGADVNAGLDLGLGADVDADLDFGLDVDLGLDADLGLFDSRSGNQQNRGNNNQRRRQRRAADDSLFDDLDFDLNLDSDLDFGLSADAKTNVGVGANLGVGANVGANAGLGVGTNAGTGVRLGLGAGLGLGTNLGLSAGLGARGNTGTNAGLNVGLGLGTASRNRAGLGLGLGAGLGVGAGLGLNTGLGIGAGLGVNAGAGVGAGLDVGVNAGLGADVGVGAGLGVNADLGVNAGLGVVTEIGLGQGVNADGSANGQLSILNVLPQILANRLYQSTALYTSATMVGTRKVVSLIAQGIAAEFGLPLAAIFLRSYDQSFVNNSDNNFGINIISLSVALTDTLAGAGILNSTFSILTADQLATAVVAKLSSLIATSLDTKDWTVRPRWTYLLSQDQFQPPLAPGYNLYK